MACPRIRTNHMLVLQEFAATIWHAPRLLSHKIVLYSHVICSKTQHSRCRQLHCVTYKVKCLHTACMHLLVLSVRKCIILSYIGNTTTMWARVRVGPKCQLPVTVSYIPAPKTCAPSHMRSSHLSLQISTNASSDSTVCKSSTHAVLPTCHIS